MIALVGKMKTRSWGQVTVTQERYLGPEGPRAIILSLEDGEPLAKLSVNVPESALLPDDCFYVKTWGENEELAKDAADSGLFIERMDLPRAVCGYASAKVWQIKQGG